MFLFISKAYLKGLPEVLVDILNHLLLYTKLNIILKKKLIWGLFNWFLFYSHKLEWKKSYKIWKNTQQKSERARDCCSKWRTLVFYYCLNNALALQSFSFDIHWMLNFFPHLFFFPFCCNLCSHHLSCQKKSMYAFLQVYSYLLFRYLDFVESVLTVLHFCCTFLCVSACVCVFMRVFVWRVSCRIWVCFGAAKKDESHGKVGQRPCCLLESSSTVLYSFVYMKIF